MYSDNGFEPGELEGGWSLQMRFTVEDSRLARMLGSNFVHERSFQYLLVPLVNTWKEFIYSYKMCASVRNKEQVLHIYLTLM